MEKYLHYWSMRARNQVMVLSLRLLMVMRVIRVAVVVMKTVVVKEEKEWLKEDQLVVLDHR